jgi:AAA+ ATPase superfamily predicted ATPase
MKFYNRENELALLDSIEKMSETMAQMTFVVGRRRIGKTSLIIKATEKQDILYFFIAKKSEVLLCAEFTEQLKDRLQMPLFGEMKTFKELFGFIMELSKNRHFILFIDEF